jgi:hypothetical protein
MNQNACKRSRSNGHQQMGFFPIMPVYSSWLASTYMALDHKHFDVEDRSFSS